MPLIDKILVSEREKSADGTVKQEIKIYYKFIGFVGELHITPTKRWTRYPLNTVRCAVLNMSRFWHIEVLSCLRQEDTEGAWD